MPDGKAGDREVFPAGRSHMLSDALQPEIGELIEKRDFGTLKGVLAGLELADVAELAGGLEGRELGVVSSRER